MYYEQFYCLQLYFYIKYLKIYGNNVCADEIVTHAFIFRKINFNYPYDYLDNEDQIPLF